MNVILYYNSSDPRVLNKAISQVGEAGHATQATDSFLIENPVLLMDYDVDYVSANYFYIEEFGRYYYMTESPEIVNGNQLRITGHVDVLMSHKNAVKNADIIANRSASNNNPYIPDNMIGDQGTLQHYIRSISSTPFNATSNNYVLHIAGKN